ncbi:MAG TPA: chemotaxis protein CheW [Candidatus Binatia bacterium]|nr:chemotaxis protein CheW [Candidatus Binatia bacterium]
MTRQSRAAAEPAHAEINDCWNRIGVRGDGTCKELEKHIHCRNCPVFGAAATELLNGRVPAEYIAEWTRHFARPAKAGDAGTISVVVFRIGEEWLALPTGIFEEVAELRPIHSLPELREGVVMGLVNVRGELLVCVSLARMLGLPPAAPHKDERHHAPPRLLVIRYEKSRTVFPADEVYGIHRFQARDLKEPPATVVNAMVHFACGILPWQDKSVGLLDDGLLCHALNRSLSSATPH